MILAIFAVIWSLLTHPVYALSPPILSDPPNHSVINSGPKLIWQAVTDSTEYKIMIDDEPSITSPYAKTPYYTKNTYYSPKLNAGSYYWKVGAKDSSGTWFWSEVWFFTLSTSTPSPTPTPTSTPSSFSSSSSTSSSSSSSFTISNVPSQINSDQSFTISVNLSLPNNPSTTFYLKGAFKTSDSSNYFGQTKVSGAWIKNGSTYSSQFTIATDSSGNWSGNLEVKPDADDSGFTGSGDYIFKVGRYTSSGSGPTWSNEQTIKIIAIAEGSDSTETISDNSPSPSSTTSTSQIKSSGKTEYKLASIAGVAATATPSSTPTEIKSQKQINFPLIIGILLIISGLGLFSYIYLRGSETIFNKFRKRN